MEAKFYLSELDGCVEAGEIAGIDLLCYVIFGRLKEGRIEAMVTTTMIMMIDDESMKYNYIYSSKTSFLNPRIQWMNKLLINSLVVSQEGSWSFNFFCFFSIQMGHYIDDVYHLDKN